MNTNIGIFAAEYYLPPKKKALSDIFRDEEMPAEPLAASVDFKKDIGIEAVHVAGDETAASLAINAALRHGTPRSSRPRCSSTPIRSTRMSTSWKWSI